MNIDLSKTQAQMDWLKQKLYLDAISTKAAKRVVKRGQVYYCDLGMGVGSELQKNRPCVIIQNDVGNVQSPITTVIPITHTSKSLSCFVKISDKYDSSGTLILDGSANVSAIKSIDKARIGDYVCDLDKTEMCEIDKAIAKNIDIYKHYISLENKYNDKLIYIDKLNTVLDDIKEILGVSDNDKIIPELEKLLDK